MKLTETTWPEITEKLEQGTDLKAVMVLGSLEQHGHHLPLATDTLLGMELWNQVEPTRDDILLLPALPYGCSEIWRSFPGTISLRPLVLISVIQDVAVCLARHGVKNLVLHCAHGGNLSVAQAAAREYAFKDSPPRIFVLPPTHGLDASLCEGRHFGHAGEVETSMGQVAFPRLVRMDQAKGGTISSWIRPRDLTIDEYDRDAVGVHGSPEFASKEKGMAFLDSVCRATNTWLDSL